MKLQSNRLLMALGILLPLISGAQPSISSFSPAYGGPGDSVVINGSGFTGGVLTVRFNGTIDYTAEATTYTQIHATVPNGATTGPISVQINGGDPMSSLNDFTVITAGPYIASFTPTNGSSATRITISGAHFSSATGAYFNGTAGTSFFVQSDTSIQVYPPSGVTTGPISVRSPLGTNTSTGLFYVAPSITSFSPFAGRTGTNVIVRGKNFLGATSVTLNGTNTSFTVLSNTAVSVPVPLLATTGKVRVNAPAGSFTTTSNFVIRPTIHSFSPQGGPRNSSVAITGANLNVGTPTIRFNGTAATYSGLSFGQVTAVVPATATTGPISITTTDGSHTNATIFYITPSITSFTPTNSAPGSRVKITGVNFTGATDVSFGGVPSESFTITNNTTIGATVPLGVATGPVTVSNPGGTATSSALFYGPPLISSFSPTHGLPGTNVTVFGTNLLGATAVRFNGLGGTSLVATNNGFLTVKVPPGAQAGPISVVTPAGTNVSGESFILDYVDLVVGITASPEYVFTGSNFLFSITVSNKGPANAPSVYLTNNLLAGVALLSAATSQGTIRTNPLPILADLGTIAANATAEIELGAVYHGAGTVQIASGVTSSYLDLTPADNTALFSLVVLPPAVLSITNLADQVRVSWPLMLSNFNVQSRTGMFSTNIWANVLKGRTNTTTENVLVETNSAARKFYRLRSP